MLSDKKPRFSFSLTINDLSNIPQISGHCYIEISIRNSNSLIKPLRIRNKLAKLSHDDHNDHDNDEGLTFSSHDKNKGCTGIIKGSTVSAITSKRKIHNFKCAFNFNLSCNLKFPYKKSQNLIGNKFLILKVYYILQETNEEVLVGKTEINLSEYLNFDDAVTSKYLLKDAKINSILSLTIDLKELSDQQDFHTLLQLNENVSAERVASSSLSQSSHQGTFNVPQFERKNVFGGFNNAIKDDDSKKPNPTNSKVASESNSLNIETSHQNPDNSTASVNSSKKSQKAQSKSSRTEPTKPEALPTSETHTQQLGITMDPIVCGLHRKILESTWDPELLPLLNYTPEMCINDIFNNANNPKGWCPEIFKTIGRWDDDDDENDNDDVRNLNGLISESRLREDLKSWSVEVEQKS